MRIVELTREHLGLLTAFFSALTERDRTFIESDVTDPRTIERMPDEPGSHWVALDAGDDDVIVGFASVRPLSGWSDHVGNLNLIVHPDHRGAGVGIALARHALTESLHAGLRKLQVEVAADHESAIEMFTDLGFTAEALLSDHIRDRNGEYRDLVVLSHIVDETWAAMDSIGLSDELAQ